MARSKAPELRVLAHHLHMHMDHSSRTLARTKMARVGLHIYTYTNTISFCSFLFPEHALTEVDMVKYFGSDVNKNVLMLVMSRHFKPDAKRVKDHADAGGDAKDVNLMEGKDGRG